MSTNSLMIDAAYNRLLSYLSLPFPLEYSPWLSEKYQAEVYLKLELLRLPRTFKIRGALNFLVQLPGEERRKGVVMASGDNHALAVACAAYLFGISSMAVMTTGAPANIAEICRGYGAEVVIHGAVY
ncbi:MAG: pyridoxal-phosphate dependent enzyme [Firmicutes bacterium]|nr:pyridoxal-phosphate dependent enzyme [Bacillota bacterium]MCL5015332.1 pyridoxal-phosphate dependent enzyme [Bacillota bacterium]